MAQDNQNINNSKEKSGFFYYQDNIGSTLVFGNENKDVDLTIVVPTYKRYDLIKKTIFSICNLEKPKHISYKVVIVSNDPEFEYEKLGLELDENIFMIYVNNENLGMVGNINRCSTLSFGKYVAFVHDDDLLCPNYLVEIEKIIPLMEKKNISSVVPGRYIFSDNKKMMSRFQMKYMLNRIVFWKYRKLLRIDYKDCEKTWNNCFCGGPTCGIIFNRESLLNSEGFDYQFPFIFDYVFFIKFSFNNKVCLLNKFLGIYRMVDNASSKAVTQVDFFEGEKYILELLKEKEQSKSLYKREKYILKLNYDIRSDEAKSMILEKYPDVNNVSKFGYRIFRIKRLLALFRKGVFRWKKLPKRMQDLV